MDEVEHLRLTDLNKSIYKKRKQTIERIFADAKENMRWTKYRGLEKVYDASVCNDLKKLASSKFRKKSDKRRLKLKLRVRDVFCLLRCTQLFWYI